MKSHCETLMNREEFSRTALLLGDRGMEALREKRVCLFGCGGVGGFAAEALVRSGVGHIEIVDSDTVALSNINRQIIALHSSLGRKKVDVLSERLLDIHPELDITARPVFFLPENAGEFDFSSYDYVIDAVDTVTAKLEIIERCQRAGVPVISSMGAGNKLDPTRFRVADIYETSVCPLARVMRRELKKRGIESLKVVYSTEPPLKPGTGLPEGSPLPNGRRSIPGSVAWVPSVAGLILGGEVIKDLLSGSRNILP